MFMKTVALTVAIGLTGSGSGEVRVRAQESGGGMFSAGTGTLVDVLMGFPETLILRVCLTSQAASRQAASIERPAVKIRWIAADGAAVLEKELHVPLGQFRCVDTTQAELVGQGLPAEPNSRVQFRLRISSPPDDADPIDGNEKITIHGQYPIIFKGEITTIEPGAGITVNPLKIELLGLHVR